MYKVIHPFRDLEDKNKTNPNGRLYNVGDTFPATQRKVDDSRVSELLGANNKVGYPLIEFVETVDTEEYPQHTGGGYYELSDGSKVKGKDKAEAAEKKLGE